MKGNTGNVDFNAAFNRILNRQLTGRRPDRTYVRDKDLKAMSVKVKMQRTNHGDNEAKPRANTGTAGGGVKARSRFTRSARKMNGFIR